MARPTRNIISSISQSWDADIDANFAMIFEGPFPIYQDATPPTASNYEDCILVDTHVIKMSDGTNWLIVAFQGDAVPALDDNSTGSLGSPPEYIYPVTDVATAADAIAVLASKINEIIAALQTGGALP